MLLSYYWWVQYSQTLSRNYTENSFQIGSFMYIYFKSMKKLMLFFIFLVYVYKLIFHNE